MPNQNDKMSPPVKDSTMDFVVTGIAHVCNTFKRRAPGTQSERDAQDFFAKELDQWSDKVTVEDFSLRPAAFMGFFWISVILAIAGSVTFFFNFFNPSVALTIVSFVMLLLSMTMVFAEFFFYREFIDFLFPKAMSKNVYAVRKPKGEVKKHIIFGGHADAPWEFTYFLHGQVKALAPMFLGAIGGGIAGTILVGIYLAMGTPPITGFWLFVAIFLLALIPFFISVLFFVNWNVICDGANDNLSACSASMAIMKELAENDTRFENTEVCCLITGSEEAGLRGAKAFAKKHAKELKKVDTVFLPFEVLRETEHLTVYKRDLNGSVRCDKALVDLLLAAGNKVGVSMKCAPIPLGATDAAAFTQAGLRAACICGSQDKPQTYYHTRHDTCDNISPECIQTAIEIGYETAYMFDAGE
ncbi:MAG TPA: M20/M25/M40 family metallo-hydrolase [Clostridia bacterium]|nr:M20/M25/M40 family metallo-hydrolase [Clostridia bacterium]